MPQQTLMGQILSALENQWVVFAVALFLLIIRLLFAGYRRRNPLPIINTDGKKRKDFTMEVIDTLLIAAILVFGIVRPYFVQTFFIPSGSMESTLMGPREENGSKIGGDRLIGNRFIFRFRAPERGEIVIFQPPTPAVIGSSQPLVSGLPGFAFRKPVAFPAFVLRRWVTENPRELKKLNPNWNSDEMLASLPELPARPEDYIKRVIGVPGDRIRIVKDEGVYLNGAKTPIADEYVDRSITPTAPVSFPEAKEDPGPPPVLGNDKSDTDMNNFIVSLYEWLVKYDEFYRYKNYIVPNVVNGEFVVPPECYFVSGDHRNSSFDSRYWGIVPRANIRARAISTFWPLNRLKLL